MIIDFMVENFRSIKQAVTLSAVAQSRGAARAGRHASRPYIRPDDEIAPAYPVVGRGFELLPVLAIFGANASGKSNVLNALDYLLFFMTQGAGDARVLGRLFAPFKLDAAGPTVPTRFELRIALEEAIYTYSLWVNRSGILLECLEHTPPPPKQRRLLFERRWSENDQRFHWKNGDSFAGPHTRLEASLKDYEPFISLLVQRLKVALTEPLAEWLRMRMPGVSLGYIELDLATVASLLHEFPEAHAWVSTVICRFDTGIARIELRPVREAPSGEVIGYEPIFWHDTMTAPIPLSLEEESTGTLRLFRLAPVVYLALRSQMPLLVDELGANVHPHITRTIVQLFQDPRTNPKRSQLIFTSHDNTLQHGQLLRRDQIWFTEKRQDGTTDLYPLSDFKVRNDLAIDRAYLDGRFGAVPILPDSEDLLPTEELAR